MGHVIPFKPTRRRPRRLVEPADTVAEVLIFTGVRYERMAEPESEPTPGKRAIRASGRGRRSRPRVAS